MLIAMEQLQIWLKNRESGGNAKFGSMFLTPLCRPLWGWMLGWADVLFDPAADDEAEITMTDCLWPNFN